MGGYLGFGLKWVRVYAGKFLAILPKGRGDTTMR